MPYTAEISRANPSCYLFLIDQSKSMTGSMRGQRSQRKADVLAEAINRLLMTLVFRCVRSEGVHDLFHLGVIGYGRGVTSSLGGGLTGRGLVPVSDVAKHPLRVEHRKKSIDDGAGGILEQTIRCPVWFEPAADGNTPMCAALDLAGQILAEFLVRFPSCYPPVVLNITDGEASDGDPEPPAASVRNLASEDGNALLFNTHLSSGPGAAIEFPDDEAGLADAFARRLFRMSSLLPPPMRRLAATLSVPPSDTARGFIFNADPDTLLRFLDIGTRVDSRNLR